MEDNSGKRIDRYEIKQLLGQGGMATVYRALDTRLKREVAIKLIRRSAFPAEMLDRILARFEREAQSMARLSHHNIVKVYDYGEYDGAPYLVLEYLPGGDLKTRLNGQRITWQEAIKLILPIASALQFSHTQGIIHRDIKPSNILFSVSGEPLLSDFGIAKILEYDEAATLTGTGVGVGTPGYMAPEQWTGDTSPQSDQYGLGIVLYEMICGCKPYHADTPAGILIKQTSQPVPPPRKFAPEVPQNVENALLKALDKDPAARFADMGAFVKAFESLLAAPASQTAPVDFGTATTLNVVQDLPTQDTPPPPLTVTQQTPVPLPSVAPPAERRPLPWGKLAAGFGALTAVVLAILFLPQFITLPATTSSVTITSTATTTKAIATSQVTVALLSPTLTPVPPSTTPTETLTPTPTGLAVKITPLDPHGNPITMQLVPAGTFTMGSNNDRVDEKPAHNVTLDSYYMDTYEVSTSLYKSCVEAGACTKPSNTGRYDGLDYSNRPVVYVDWNQAKTYCEWRGARLPTEAEWEKAARGTDGRVYPWGEGIDCGRANYYDSLNSGYCGGDITVVGKYQRGKSPYGMYDMAGNTWEWVADWYDSSYYNQSPSTNPIGPESGYERVLRGGSWINTWNYVRTSNRSSDFPDTGRDDIGFRCAMSVASP